MTVINQTVSSAISSNQKGKLKALVKTLSLISICFYASSTLAKTEVQFWYSGGVKPQELMKTLIDEFNANQDEYVIKGVVQGNYTETFQKLQAGLASKTAPALALVEMNDAILMKDRKLSKNLSPLMDDAFNFNDFLPAFREIAEPTPNQIYALPAYGTTQVLYYNKAVLAENGFTEADLKTWQGLGKVAQTVTKKNAQGQTEYYGWEPMWGSLNLVDAALSNGAEFISKDGKTVLINSDAWVDVFEQFRKWIHEDKIMRIHHGGQGWEYWYKTIDDVMKDRALGYTGSSGDQGDLDFSKLGAVPQPGFGNNPSKPQVESLWLVIPEQTADEVAKGAFEFMNYYTSAKNTGRWSMTTGYIPVRKSVEKDPDYSAFVKENPQALVPLTQASFGHPALIDPTNGKIFDLLSIAADKIEIENIPARQVLDDAQKKAQKALDKINK